MGAAPRVLRVVEDLNDDFMESERESFGRLLLENLPPIVFQDLSLINEGEGIGGRCPIWPSIPDASGGEVLIERTIRSGALTERARRRRLLSTYAHEVSHRITPEEIRAGQAHGAVFAAVCAALSARILGNWARGMDQVGWYEVQNCPQPGLALEHAAEFSKAHFESGVRARDLPDLARQTTAVLALLIGVRARDLPDLARASWAARIARAGEGEALAADLASAREEAARAGNARRALEGRALRAEREKTLGWGEILAGLALAAALGALFGGALL